jgi:hypothetical protein
MQGPLLASGHFSHETEVKHGFRAPGRGRARTYGPVQSPAMYKKARAKARARARAQARLSDLHISAAKYQGKARTPRGFARKLKAAKARKRAGHKNVFATRTIRQGQRVAGLIRRNNPRGGASMAHHHRRRRRRNPGGLNVKALIKQLISAAIPAVGAGAAMSLVDTKLLAGKSQAIRYAGKVGLAAAIALLLRSRPTAAATAMGAVFGSLGYDLGTKLGGPASTMSHIAYLVAADRQAMNALIDSNGQPQTTPSLNGMGRPAMNGPNDLSLG